MGDDEIQSEEKWHYPKPRFKYWWVCWTVFVLIVFYIGYGFVLAGEGSWLELILLTIAMMLYPASGCYRVKTIPKSEVLTERAETDIETSRAIQKEEL